MQSEFFVWQPECLFSLAALSLRAPGPGRAVCGTMKRLIQKPLMYAVFAKYVVLLFLSTDNSFSIFSRFCPVRSLNNGLGRQSRSRSGCAR